MTIIELGQEVKYGDTIDFLASENMLEEFLEEYGDFDLDLLKKLYENNIMNKVIENLISDIEESALVWELETEIKEVVERQGGDTVVIRELLDKYKDDFYIVKVDNKNGVIRRMSAYPNITTIDEEQLKGHYGHEIGIVKYGDENYALECHRCSQVLVDTDKEL